MIETDVLTCGCKDVLYPQLTPRKAAPAGWIRSRLPAHEAWLLALIKVEPDLTLAAVADRLLAEHGVKADAGMLSRFFRARGISFKKRRYYT